MKQEIQNKPVVINTRTVFNQNLDSLLELPERKNSRDKKNNSRQSKEQQKYEKMARDYYCGY